MDLPIKELVDEFVEHGQIDNSLNLIKYGYTILSTMKRHDCSLGELLESMKQAVMIQVQSLPGGN